MKKYFLIPVLYIAAISCNNNSNEHANASNDETVVATTDTLVKIPEMRLSVSDQPVAVFNKQVADKLNTNWKFSVMLYETKYTFRYKATFQYEEVRGEDTIVFPDLGYMPKPILNQGPDKYSCVIGFNDKKGEFKPLKLVTAANDKLTVKTLKHYVVVNN